MNAGPATAVFAGVRELLQERGVPRIRNMNEYVKHLFGVFWDLCDVESSLCAKQ